MSDGGDGEKEKEKCRFGYEHNCKPHLCPYKIEMNDDSKTLCQCCERCERECRDDI